MAICIVKGFNLIYKEEKANRVMDTTILFCSAGSTYSLHWREGGTATDTAICSSYMPYLIYRRKKPIA